MMCAVVSSEAGVFFGAGLSGKDSEGEVEDDKFAEELADADHAYLVVDGLADVSKSVGDPGEMECQDNIEHHHSKSSAQTGAHAQILHDLQKEEKKTKTKSSN